jgi:hypothetical protein
MINNKFLCLNFPFANWCNPSHLSKKAHSLCLISSIAMGVFAKYLFTAACGFNVGFLTGALFSFVSYYAIQFFFKKQNQVNSSSSVNPSSTNKIMPPSNTQPSTLNVSSKDIAIPHSAHITIKTMNAGYVGEDKERLLSMEGLKDWKNRDGSEFALEKEEIIFTMMIFDESASLLEICNDFTFYMPASLFENKTEGDVIELLYKDQPIELKIKPLENQKKSLKQECGRSSLFESIFKNVKNSFLKNFEDGEFGFSGNLFYFDNSNEEYTLEHQGILFQFSQNSTFPSIAQSQHLRELKNPKACPFCVKKEEENLLIRGPLPVTKNVDIILNEKYLCFYSSEDLPPIQFATNAKKIFSSMSKNEIKTEGLSIIRWKHHLNYPLEDIKNLITQSECILKDGIFTMKIPLKYSPYVK